jgi:SAM-dependent methyltransferase
MKGAKLALVLGDGDGRFTERLLRENPQVSVDAVDLSPAMLDALVRRAGDQASRVRTQVADVRAWTPSDERRYDLVVTHFFLDCLTTAEVAALAARVRPQLTANAIWVVSEFAIPEGRFGRWGARRIVGFLYRAFGLMTGLRVRELPDHAAALERTKFRLQGHKSRLRGLLVTEFWTRD